MHRNQKTINMVRIAVLDFHEHRLYVEDVADEEIENYGGVDAYVKDTYTFEGEASWDAITDAEYIGLGESDPVEIDFDIS